MLIVIVSFIDGQKIAKKLCSQISQETKQTKSLLEEYDACQCDPTTKVVLSEALDPSALGARLASLGIWTATTASGKRHDAIQAYLALSRSKEEILMLNDEANNVFHFYDSKKKVIERELQDRFLKFDPLSRGENALLHQLLDETNHQLEQINMTLGVMSSTQTVPSELDDTDDDSTLSDSDENDDY